MLRKIMKESDNEKNRILSRKERRMRGKRRERRREREGEKERERERESCLM